jgi:predicted RNase H-like nuclease (RuvC/YqgF family)
LQASIEAKLEARISEIQKQTEREKAIVAKDIQSRDAQIKDLNKRISDQVTAY